MWCDCGVSGEGGCCGFTRIVFTRREEGDRFFAPTGACGVVCGGDEGAHAGAPPTAADGVVRSCSSEHILLSQLPLVLHGIGQDNGCHRFRYRHEPRADARVVSAFHGDLSFPSLMIAGLLRGADCWGGFLFLFQ